MQATIFYKENKGFSTLGKAPVFRNQVGTPVNMKIEHKVRIT